MRIERWKGGERDNEDSDTRATDGVPNLVSPDYRDQFLLKKGQRIR